MSRKVAGTNELVIRSEAGKEICTLRFTDEEWERLLSVALGRLVNDALAHYLDRQGDSTK